MALTLYNTFSKRKEELVPLEPGKIRMYSCGPTVYDYFHIGNARSFIVPDVLRRYLEYRGYEVTYVQNITDVDDKIINVAQLEGVDVEEVVDRYSVAFEEDSRRLSIRTPDFRPTATGHIDEMLGLIRQLVDKGHAYVLDGDVYFDVPSFAGYGQLSRQNIDQVEVGSRVGINEKKRSPLDFALWKAAKPGEPSWESPFGRGRPGWHTECSAMSMKYLGETVDIHAGGADLVFPHHENERAQSEAVTSKPFARHWVHIGFVNIDGEKMSKSQGNFKTVRDLLEVFDGEVIRLFILMTHYRKPLSFSLESLESASKSLKRLYEGYISALDGADRVRERQETDHPLARTVSEIRERFRLAMDSDLNTAAAIACLHDLGRHVRASLAETDADERARAEALSLAVQLFDEMGQVLGLLGKPDDYRAVEGSEEQLMEVIIAIRQKLREKKDYALADTVRDLLKDAGIQLEDTPSGVRWRKG